MPYSTWILQPEENYLVTINIPKTAMESTCDYNNKHIEGTSLIHFENCTIFINNLTYSSQQFLEWDSIHIIPVNNIEIKEAQVINNMSLETLSKYHFENQNQIELISTRLHHHNHILQGLIILIIIFCIMLFVYGLQTRLQTLLQRFKRYFTTNQNEPDLSTIPTQQELFSWQSS